MADAFGSFPFPFNLIPYFIAIMFVIVPVFMVLNFRKLKKSGVSPLTPMADLAGRLANSELLSAAKPVEQRLAELDQLFAKGTISKEEHAAARLKILAE